MYDFLYLFFYNFFKWKQEDDALDSAIYGVMVPIMTHLFMLYTAIAYMTNYNLLADVFGTDKSKYFFSPFVIAFIYILHRIYKKRGAELLVKRTPPLLNAVNIIKVLLLTIGPLILGISFLNEWW